MNTESFFAPSIFTPQIEFTYPSAPESGTAGDRGGVSMPSRFLFRMRALSFAAATVLLSQVAITQSEIVRVSNVLHDEVRASALTAEDLVAIRSGDPLNRSAHLREAARQAVSRLGGRKGESIDAWAERIAADVADSTD